MPLKLAILPVTPLQQNCTILWDEATMAGAIVDPGGDLDEIKRAIRELGIRVEKILLTHGHIDHAAGAADLKAALQVAIEGPNEADRFLLDQLPTQGLMFGIPAKAVTPDRWLTDGDTVTVAGHSFEIFHCPGHSPGSVVFFHPVQRIALVGDVLFKGSIGRTDFPYGDHDALITSIKTKLLPLGDDIGFVCGHGPTSSFGAERRTNPFLA